MTPDFRTGLALIPAAAIIRPAALGSRDAAAMPRTRDYATIIIGTHRHAQGPIVARLPRGRVSIDAGGRVLTGHPLAAGPAPRGLWARIGSRRIS